MLKKFYINDECVLTRDCSKNTTECPIEQYIDLNKLVRCDVFPNPNITRIKAFYDKEKATTFRTICDNCSKQRD